MLSHRGEGGCQKRADMTNRLRDWDSDKVGGGPNICEICVTSFLDGPLGYILRSCWRSFNLHVPQSQVKFGATWLYCENWSERDVTLKLPTFLLFALFASSIERIGRCAAEEGRHFQQPNHRHPVAISHRSLSYPSLLRKLSFATQGKSILLLRQEHIQLFNICIQRNSFLVICEIFDIMGL